MLTDINRGQKHIHGACIFHFQCTFSFIIDTTFLKSTLINRHIKGVKLDSVMPKNRISKLQQQDNRKFKFIKGHNKRPYQRFKLTFTALI